MDYVKSEGRARPVGVKKMKQQDSVAADLRKSARMMAELVTEVSRGNDLMERTATQFSDAADHIAEIRLMQWLPANSNAYNEIMEDLLLERTNRKKRKRCELEKACGDKEAINEVQGEDVS